MKNAAIKKQPSGRYQLSYTHPQTLKRVRKLFDYRKDAELYAARIGAHKADSDHLKGRLFIGNLIKEHLKQNPGSRLVERRNSFKAFCNTFSALDVENLTTPALREFFNRLKEENNYSNLTLMCIRINLNHFFKWLVAENYLMVNPLTPVRYRINKTLQRPRVLVTEAELADALPKLKALEPAAWAVVVAICHTGSRKNEMRELRWKQVDFTTGYITFTNTKSGDDRSVLMGTALKAHMQALADAQAKPLSPNGFVFLNDQGFVVSPYRIERALRKLWARNPDMKKFRCHDLRHSFAYNFLKTGGSMYQLQAILGHKQIGLTVDLYGGLKAVDIDRVSPYGRL